MIPLYIPFSVTFAALGAAFFWPLGKTFEADFQRVGLLFIAMLVSMIVWMLTAISR